LATIPLELQTTNFKWIYINDDVQAFPIRKGLEKPTETTIQQMLGIGIPGQSHTIQGQLVVVLTLHLRLGLLVPRLLPVTQLGLGWDSGSYKFMPLFKR